MNHSNYRSSSTVERDILRKERFDLLKALEFLSEVDWITVDIDLECQDLLEDLDNLTELYSDDDRIQSLIAEIQAALPSQE